MSTELVRLGDSVDRMATALETFLERLAEPPPSIELESKGDHWDILEALVMNGAHITIGLDDKHMPYLKSMAVNGFSGQLYQHSSFEAVISHFFKDSIRRGAIQSSPAADQVPNGD